MADQLIFSGHVEVNGMKADNPAIKVSPADRISIKGKALRQSVKPLYIIMNKPIQVISSVRDPQKRTTVIDILPERYKGCRLYPVGRLDYFSQGLLLMTNDGDLANALTHPSFNHEKKYEVIIRGQVQRENLEKLKKGLLLEGKIRLRPIQVQQENLSGNDTRLILTLKQGINRQIRRICDQFGWTILKLKRISEASLKLGDLKPGECRELSSAELAELKRSSGRVPRKLNPVANSAI